jgi:PEP-CTERM motif-containing protein
VTRSLRILAILVLAAAWSRNAGATSFTFSGVDAGGTGSATMNISIVGNTLTLTLNNTSPTVLNNGTGSNYPGITGFGFNLSNSATTSLTSWTLNAQTYSNGTLGSTLIGGSSAPSSAEWIMGTTFNNVNLNYLPNTGPSAPGSTISGALYNPSAASALQTGSGNNSAFYTTATVVMNFSSAPSLSIGAFSPYVRFQNVGLNGAGSLKLTGTPQQPPPPVVPEPTTLVLVGTAAVIGAARMRRKGRR